MMAYVCVCRAVGRHQCECQASKHSLVNNCRNCGRVVCEQEGSGPCFFCRSLVCFFTAMRVFFSCGLHSCVVFCHFSPVLFTLDFSAFCYSFLNIGFHFKLEQLMYVFLGNYEADWL